MLCCARRKTPDFECARLTFFRTLPTRQARLLLLHNSTPSDQGCLRTALRTVLAASPLLETIPCWILITITDTLQPRRYLSTSVDVPYDLVQSVVTTNGARHYYSRKNFPCCDVFALIVYPVPYRYPGCSSNMTVTMCSSPRRALLILVLIGLHVDYVHATTSADRLLLSMIDSTTMVAEAEVVSLKAEQELLVTPPTECGMVLKIRKILHKSSIEATTQPNTVCLDRFWRRSRGAIGPLDVVLVLLQPLSRSELVWKYPKEERIHGVVMKLQSPQQASVTRELVSSWIDICGMKNSFDRERRIIDCLIKALTIDGLSNEAALDLSCGSISLIRNGRSNWEGIAFCLTRTDMERIQDLLTAGLIPSGHGRHALMMHLAKQGYVTDVIRLNSYKQGVITTPK